MDGQKFCCNAFHCSWIQPISVVRQNKKINKWGGGVKASIEINRPHVVTAYNENMGGVNLCDYDFILQNQYLQQNMACVAFPPFYFHIKLLLNEFKDNFKKESICFNHLMTIV